VPDEYLIHKYVKRTLLLSVHGPQVNAGGVYSAYLFFNFAYFPEKCNFPAFNFVTSERPNTMDRRWPCLPDMSSEDTPS
jgi:hypothetical protein